MYVAGPYSTGNPEINTEHAIRYGEEIVKLGADPFIPHLSHYRHLLYPHPYEFWIAEDLRWLEVCDALFRFPGKSSGANNEVKVMTGVHMKPVFTDLNTLGKWIQEWNQEVSD